MSKNKVSGLVTLFTDGASRGNPGPAAVGAVLYSSGGEKIAEVSRCLGNATNNEAEYLAVVYGLREAALCGVREIVLKTDSQLVSRQLNGSYRVKNPRVRLFFDLARGMFKFFDKVEVVEIPREENGESDLLANKALDEGSLI